MSIFIQRIKNKYIKKIYIVFGSALNKCEIKKYIKIYLPDEILAMIGLTGCHATSRSNSPFVPWRIFTRFPMLFSQMYKACCRAEPAQIYSPSPEKQHFFHIVLNSENTVCKKIVISKIK